MPEAKVQDVASVGLGSFLAASWKRNIDQPDATWFYISLARENFIWLILIFFDMKIWEYSFENPPPKK